MCAFNAGDVKRPCTMRATDPKHNAASTVSVSVSVADSQRQLAPTSSLPHFAPVGAALR